MATKKTVVPKAAEDDAETRKPAETEEAEGKVMMAEAAPEVPAEGMARMGISFPAAGSKSETPHVSAVREMLFGEMPVI